MNIRDVSSVVSEALLRSDLERTAAKKLSDDKPPYTITISREVGALGNALGAELGRRLGWPVYDQELINMIAEKIGPKAANVGGLDERHIGLRKTVRNYSRRYRRTI